MTTIDIAKIYVRSIVGAVCLTAGVSFFAYLGYLTENIALGYIAGVVACALLDKPVATNQ